MNDLDHRNSKKRRKRILTDARKEQNRVAQRAYRQRQKENIWKTPRIHELRPLRLCTEKESARSEATGSRPTAGESNTNLNNNDRIRQTDNFQTPGEFDWMQQPDFMQVEELTPGQLSSFSIVPCSDSSMMNIPPIWDSVLTRSSCLTPYLDGNPPSDAPLFRANSLDSPVLGNSPQTLYDALQLVSSLAATERNCEAQHGELNDFSMAWSLTFSPSSQVFPFYPENPSHISENNDSQTPPNTNSEGLFLGIDHQTQNITTHTSLPWPTKTNLWLPQPSILTAALHNALSLNITLPSLLTSSPLSPFYRSSTLPSDDPVALLSTASNPSFPPHLQPTLPQILFPHHAYLDLVPFPVLRARAITLAVTSPRLFDPMDLKRDIMGDGLVYSRAEANGQPWDGRSWEVAPWFLRKWRMLMVGEEGSFWR